MRKSYKTIYENGQGEIVEKKSRFIANVRLVETEEEAAAFVEEMKKKYWDARHNCHAYVIGENREITRCSDDGEPSGTAGRPMLDVLLGEDMYNTAVVVTRYFGGTLLGTGGLVRAYSASVQEGLRNSVIIEKQWGVSMEVRTDYNGFGKIQYLVREDGYPILHTDYTDVVTAKILVPIDFVDRFKNAVTDATNGRATCKENEEVYFAEVKGEYLLFQN